MHLREQTNPVRMNIYMLFAIFMCINIKIRITFISL